MVPCFPVNKFDTFLIFLLYVTSTLIPADEMSRKYSPLRKLITRWVFNIVDSDVISVFLGLGPTKQKIFMIQNVNNMGNVKYLACFYTKPVEICRKNSQCPSPRVSSYWIIKFSYCLSKMFSIIRCLKKEMCRT